MLLWRLRHATSSTSRPSSLCAAPPPCRLGYSADPRKEWESEPNRPNRTEPFNYGTGWNRTRNRTEPDRATTRPKNAGQTASIQDKLNSETNRTEPINLRKVRNRNESNPTGFFLRSATKAASSLQAVDSRGASASSFSSTCRSPFPGLFRAPAFPNCRRRRIILYCIN